MLTVSLPIILLKMLVLYINISDLPQNLTILIDLIDIFLLL